MKELDFQNIDRVNQVNFEITKGAIENVETGKANISAGSGAPSGGTANDLYIDISASRLYVNVAGTWKYVTLT